MPIRAGRLRTVLISLISLGLLLLGVIPARSQTLPTDLQTKLKSWYRVASRAAPGKWGIAIGDEDGTLLWSVRPDEEMIPASTVKLLTTGFARSVLGGDARRATRVVGAGRVDEGTGDWLGRWALELNGDPTLDNPSGEGPTLDDLAEQLAVQGIRQLHGPLQLTSAGGTAEAWYPKAWPAGNRGSIYAPMVGPVTLHENVIWLNVRPGIRVGSRAVLAGTSPQGLDALVDLHATTSGGWHSRLRLRRMADGGYLITGSVGINSGTRRIISVASDPKAIVAAAWARALQHAGIEWDRTPLAITVENDPSEVLAEVNSAPFDSLATEINRRSLNIGAELLLQWAGGRDRAAELLTEHVQQVAGVAGGVHLVDGSGMSHEDRVTPATFVYYMAKFPATPGGRNFAHLLPANGIGTLARLSSGLPAPGVVHAKTGTLSGVSTLVGYLGRKDGVLLISAMYNGPRSKTAKRSQWQLFRLMGADGVTIQADSLDTDEGDVDVDGDQTEQLGGDSVLVLPEN